MDRLRDWRWRDETSIATVSLGGGLGEKPEAIAAAGFERVEIFETDVRAYDGSLPDIGDAREQAMMSVPFFLFAAGLAAVWRGRRGAALGLWVLGVAVLLGLFRLHASDVLDIGL